MGEAIGSVLPMGVGVALSPVPIIAIILMLGTARARSNGVAFTLGWLAGLAVVGGLLLVLAGGSATSGSGAPASWVTVLKIIIGALFLVLAVRTWRGRPKEGAEAEMPGWMRAIDTFAAPKSLGAGALLSGINPKNLALTLGAMATIAQTGIPGGQQAVALTVYVLLGSVTIIAPLGIYFLMGTKAKRVLDAMKEWMAAHNAAIMTVLLLVLGAKLIGDAIAAL
ncbi:MAG TPA: GAP family protein [Streptosporangiaceae bacterium]|jgi:threonine/homoserine/homoserine lactone efflux protein